MIEAAKGARKLLVAAEGSQQAGDELLYASLSKAAPSMHSLFVTPRAVQSMNFVAVLDEIVRPSDDLEKLKITMGTLAFEHFGRTSQFRVASSSEMQSWTYFCGTW